MNCCKCGKEVDEQFFEHIRGLPPMQGYNVPPEELPVVDCAYCKQPVCGKCIYGHGLFVFTCKGECTERFLERINRKIKDDQSQEDNPVRVEPS